jgi:hypothetical protein
MRLKFGKYILLTPAEKKGQTNAQPLNDGEARPEDIVYPRQGFFRSSLRAFIDFAVPRLRAACCGDHP